MTYPICTSCDNPVVNNYGSKKYPICNKCWQNTQRPPTSDGYEEDIASDCISIGGKLCFEI